jgi:hypothetical protein
MEITLPFFVLDPYKDSGLSINLPFTPFYPTSIGCFGFSDPDLGIENDTLDINAQVTKAGIQYLLKSYARGISFKVTHMALGSGGYDASFPTRPTLVDREKEALENELIRIPITQYEAPNNDLSLGFVGRFTYDSFQGGVGEIGIIATILDSDVPGEIGTMFLFAVGHQGLNTKTSHHVTTYRIYVSL